LPEREYVETLPPPDFGRTARHAGVFVGGALLFAAGVAVLRRWRKKKSRDSATHRSPTTP